MGRWPSATAKLLHAQREAKDVPLSKFVEIASIAVARRFRCVQRIDAVSQMTHIALATEPLKELWQLFPVFGEGWKIR